MNLTTLAIIGFGIAGRSVLYTLAKEKKKYSKILVFSSNKFAFPCSLHSTAIVAPRGVSEGVSPLGDLLRSGFDCFKEHVLSERPHGVKKIIQYSGASERLEQFSKRYPKGEYRNQWQSFKLGHSTYIAQEDAFMVDPLVYLDWLKNESKDLPVEYVDDFVVKVEEGNMVLLTTQSQRDFMADKIVFTVGHHTRFWNPPVKSKPVQGAYYQFENINLGDESFSLTLDGDNLIYHHDLKRLLVGSSTLEVPHELAPINALNEIHKRLQEKVEFILPSIQQGKVKVGLREKAPKRAPYLVSKGKAYYLGGLYKNGYVLSLKMAKDLTRQLHENV